MEKIIIVWPKNFLQRMVIVNMISSVIKDVLILDPKENPDYEDIIKDAGDSLVCVLDDSETKQLKKEIWEFNKVLELKSREVLDVKVNPLMEEIPWYDRFLKKWKKNNRRPANLQSKRKWNR